MCKAPKAPQLAAPPPPKILVNPFLDNERGRLGSLVSALRTGRSSLRIDMPGPNALGFGAVGGSGAAQRGSAGAPSGNIQIGVGARSRGRAGTPGDFVDRLNTSAIRRASPNYEPPERRNNRED